nr:hypothetical protein [Tanacetum cinerariifolium]
MPPESYIVVCKANEGFFVGDSTNSKAFRVFNSRTRIVEENLHVKFSETIPNIARSRPNWLFDIDALTKSMNNKLVFVGNQSNGSACKKACDNVGKTSVEIVSDKDYILLPLWTQDPLFSSSSKDSPGAGLKPSGEEEKKDAKDPGNADIEIPRIEDPRVNQEEKDSRNNNNRINAVSSTINAANNEVNAVGRKSSIELPDDLNMPDLEDISIFEDSNKDNKLDERGIVIRNKARLVAHGHTQEEGIDYDEVFVPVARIEAIRLFLVYASFKDFVVYQMDAKSAFLYRKIKEEVYVCQPSGFENLDFPDKVYKVEKALYGLHKAPRAWKEMCTEFEKMMHKKFPNEFYGRAHIFLRSARKTEGRWIFISQDKYVNEILNKFDFSDVKTARTPLETHKTLLKDEKGKDVDEHLYRSMIGSLMYLTSLGPDIMFATKIHIDNESTICIVKNPIFHSNTNHIEATAKAKNINGEAPIHAKVDRKKVIISEATIRRDLKLEDEGGVNCLSNEVIFEQLTLMSLKRRVKKLEKNQGSRAHKLKRLYKVRLSARIEFSDEEQSSGEKDASKQGRNIVDNDTDDEITLVDEIVEDQGRFDDQEMFDTGLLDDEEVVVEKAVVVKEVDAAQDQVSVATTIVAKDLTVVDITLAKALEAFKTSKPKIRGIVVRDHKEPSKSTRIPTSIDDSTRPKAKGIVREEPSEATTTTLPIPSKVQDKGKGIMVEEPLKMKKKYQISFDEQEARRLQAELDQEQILKHRLTEEEAQKALEAKIVVINNGMISEMVKESSKKAKESSSKRVGDKLEQENAKKQKVDDDQEAAELKRCLEIVPDDEDDANINATPLSSKSPTIIDYKIHKEGRKSHFQIIRVDGSSQMYYTFSKMLKNFNREDLEVLWSIVKARFKKVQPVDNLDCYLLHTLKTVFKHHVEDSVWKNQQGLAKVKNWKLFNSCGVHCVSMQSTTYYLLVEKMYPLTNYTLTQIWNDARLQFDYEVKMAYDLLRLVRRQVREGYVSK